MKPVYPLRHVACGSGGGIDGVDLCPVSEGPCREGVYGFLKEECGPGGHSHNPEAAIGYAASLGHGPEGAVGSDSDQFGADFAATPAAPLFPGKRNLLQRQLFGPPASIADTPQSGLSSLTSLAALPRPFG